MTLFKPKLRKFLEAIDEIEEEELILILNSFSDIINHISSNEKDVLNEIDNKTE